MAEQDGDAADEVKKQFTTTLQEFQVCAGCNCDWWCVSFSIIGFCCCEFLSLLLLYSSFWCFILVFGAYAASCFVVIVATPPFFPIFLTLIIVCADPAFRPVLYHAGVFVGIVF